MALLITYAPFVWMVFLNDKFAPLRWFPLLPGVFMTLSLRIPLAASRLLEPGSWLFLLSSIGNSALLVTLLTALLFRAPKWRTRILLSGLIVSGSLSALAYQTYRIYLM